MTFRTLVARSLRFHWRAHLGVLLGAAVGGATLIGALVVGDSVRGSLRDRALQRLGRVQFALDGGDHFFTDTLAGRMPRTPLDGRSRDGGGFAAALVLPGLAARQDGQARANRIQLIGAVRLPETERTHLYSELWPFGPGPQPALPPGEVLLNEPLALQLRAKVGDELVFRLQKPSALSGDAPLSPRSGRGATLRLRVAGIVPPERLGNFALHPTGTAPLNAFVNFRELQNATQLEGRANVMVAGGSVEAPQSPSLRTADDGTATGGFQAALAARMRLADYEAALRVTPDGRQIELASRRVFLDPALVRAGLAAANRPAELLTYLVNQITAGTNATPYSMVTAAGPPWTPADLRDDEILVSQWLANDLGVKPGDEIQMSYFLPESGAALREATNAFRVRGVVPMESPWADRTLMPEFPGIENAESTADWDTAFPLVHKIRPKDEEFWKQFRGTPKAFVTLAAGRKMWANRFGDLTAIRFPVPANAAAPVIADFRAALETGILARLKPEEVGLRFEPVRAQALRAAEDSQDFGGLFLGFSFFLIASALLLMGLLFQLGVEQRATEVGTLLALGFEPKHVRRLLLAEGVALAAVGGVLGAIGGVVYAKGMLLGLATIWRDAVGAAALHFHATSQSIAIGLFASVFAAALAIRLALRGLVRRPARELLTGEMATPPAGARSRATWVAAGAVAAALGLVAWAVAKGETVNAEVFFSAGALLLVAGLGFVSVWLVQAGQATSHAGGGDGLLPDFAAAGTGRRDARPTLATLALRGAARRRSRSLATVGSLACGSFLIAAISVFRLDAHRDATQPNSGTGGFALLGEATLPVVPDLNTRSGRETFGLGETDLAGVHVVPFRVHDGDEASCLNLNRAQQPRLLGVKPEALAGRFSFAQTARGLTAAQGWALLKSDSSAGRPEPAGAAEIPAIGDANSIQWAMGKKVGDTLDYVDERGRPFRVRLVGALANSILQGSLVIDEAEFVKRYPGESGHRFFLIETPTNTVAQVSARLSRALEDYGLELTPATRRLDAFNAVQNTYLGTFQVLGGLGLLLGSAGLGVVVLRNVLERRGEFAVLLAVGFRRRTLHRLVITEHGLLLALGLGVGSLSAGVAVLPSVLSPSAPLPAGSLLLTLGGVVAVGASATWLATRWALRGDLLTALRNE